MVSLFTSFTDLLGGGSGTDTESNNQQRKLKKNFRRRSTSKERKPEMNDNISETSTSSKKASSGSGITARKSSTKVNSSGSKNFFNAESLDRAIVHRLQSKVSFISPTSTSLEIKDVTDESDSRSQSPNPANKEQVESAGDSAQINNNDPKPDISNNNQKASVKNNVYYGLATDTLFPQVVQASGIKIGAVPSNNDYTTITGTVPTPSYHLYAGQESSSPSTPYPTMSSTGENRSVVYKNAQFNLENASRETLVPDPHRENFLPGEPRRLQSMFNIPDSIIGPTDRIWANPDPVTVNVAAVPSNTGLQNSPPSRSSIFTAKFSGSSTNLAEHVFESAMNEIIEKGGEEFKNKYSSWVWEAFRSHLLHLKTILLNEFNEKIKNTLAEREQEVMTLQQQYRDKLTEFDATTEGFQKMIDNLYQENQKVLKAKDFVIEKLKKEFLECRRHFEHDLIRQMQNYRKEAEVEKLELQKRNDELMMVMLTDASKSGLEDAFKREIESLHKMIKALTTQNEVLHQQLEEATSAASIINRKTVDAVQVQLEQSNREVIELRKRLQNAERDREDLTVSHNEEIAKLNRRMQESSTRYDHQLRDATEEMENLRKRYHKESKELKQRLQAQETHHAHLLNQVKQQYGSQVESLSRAVSQLQTELTMSSANRRHL